MRCILYQNTSQNVILLDIPQSIADGSGVALVASPGPTRPYASTEPKASKRTKMLAAVPRVQQLYNEKIEKLLAEAINAVRCARGGATWCLDRAGAAVSSYIYSHLPLEVHPPDSAATTKPPLILSANENYISSVASLGNAIVFNPHDTVVKLYAGGHCFLIPPRCTFLLSSIDEGMQNFNQCLATSSGLAGPGCPGINAGEFDFILLDPPWSNRSVRHAKVYPSYSERQQEDHPYHKALHIIKQHLSQSGLTAVWITNKSAIRKLVLESMHRLDLELFEELIWLKATIHGEPVTPLDGLWRKPYEILLLFRRGNVWCKSSTDASSALRDEVAYVPNISQTQRAEEEEDEAGNLLLEYPDVRRRVVIAVPDVHSRKPCLKEPLAPLLPEGYRALEIFARNLTTGWWSWGDEVLKFNEVRTEAVEATS